MTKYKEALRRRGIRLENDFISLPCYDGVGTLEGRSVIFKHNLIIVTSFYDEVGVVTNIYDRNFSAVPFLESGSEEVKQYLTKTTHLVIYDDMINLRLMFNDDKLVCVVKGGLYLKPVRIN